jgi:hypothetical protein
VSVFSNPLNADGPSIRFKGLVQSWFSYAPQPADTDDMFGFTIRRVRFKPYGALAKNIKWTIQVAWDKQNPELKDAYLEYVPSKQLSFKVGQFSAPGSVSGSLTSSSKLDLVERSQISQLWGSFAALSSHRALGVQVHGHLMDGKLYYAVMLANPNSKTPGLFTPSVKNSDYSHDHNGMTLWGRLEAKPVKGLRIGAFYGGGKETGADFVRTSYGAHLYYVKKPFNFKAEYIAGSYGPEGSEIDYYGLYVLLGYRFGKFEPIARFDLYTPNDGAPDGEGIEQYRNFTVGINFFYHKHVKFQFNAVIREEAVGPGRGELDNNMFYVVAQYTF